MEEEEELDEDALLGNSDGEENYDDTRVTDRQGYHALEENTGLDNYAEHGDELLEEEQYGEEYGGRGRGLCGGSRGRVCGRL